MQEAFQSGIDLHRLTASRIAGVPVEQVTDAQRRAAKVMNFLLIYGGSARTLQSRVLSDYGIFMSADEAEQAKERFFSCYEGVREWQERQVSEMGYTVQHHFHNCIQGFFTLPLTATTTLLGRRRIWPRFGTGIRASRFQMYNTPCQGTGADLIKLVMCEVYEKISSEQARIINSIHDEILLEVPEERAAEYAGMLKEIMERIGSELLYPVPVKARGKGNGYSGRVRGGVVGHVLSDMEMRPAITCPKSFRGVSIGPRPFRHGNWGLFRASASIRFLLYLRAPP